MSEKLTLGSLFDGSGSFPLGGILTGIVPIWSSEISPFPILVTHKRLPTVKHYGDVSGLNGASLEPVDIITFGSPCQDMSIAGKRAGLEGSRSGLFHQAIRIIKEMRDASNGGKPRYIAWENVPGCYSSNRGEDFRIVLEEICGIKEAGVSVPRPAKGWLKAGEIVGDGYSVAWRTLDAQYYGLAQRRARCYLVADLDSECAGKILFDAEGVSGYTPPGAGAWEGTASDPEGGVGETGSFCLNDQGGTRMDMSEKITGTLRSQDHGHAPIVMAAGFCTEHSAKAGGVGYQEETAPTLRAGTVPAAIAVDNHAQDGRIGIREDGVSQTLTNRAGTGGGNVPLVAEPRAFGICSKSSYAMLSDNPNSGIYEAETSRTLDTSNQCPGKNQGGICVVEPTAFALQGSMIGRAEKNGPQGSGVNEDVSFTLTEADRHGVVYSTSKNNYHIAAHEDVAGALVASDYKDPPTVAEGPQYIVRRLTPTECARLQGFPDWWCADLAVQDPSPAELSFWTEVWETWRRLTQPDSRPKTESWIRKWLADPHTDSAEYSMWGNGCALPYVCSILAGIVYCHQNDSVQNPICSTPENA